LDESSQVEGRRAGCESNPKLRSTECGVHGKPRRETDPSPNLLSRLLAAPLVREPAVRRVRVRAADTRWHNVGFGPIDLEKALFWKDNRQPRPSSALQPSAHRRNPLTR